MSKMCKTSLTIILCIFSIANADQGKDPLSKVGIKEHPIAITREELPSDIDAWRKLAPEKQTCENAINYISQFQAPWKAAKENKELFPEYHALHFKYAGFIENNGERIALFKNPDGITHSAKLGTYFGDGSGRRIMGVKDNLMLVTIVTPGHGIFCEEIKI